MENAVKAIYIAAGLLIALMVMGVWIYLFRQGASLGQNYDTDRQTQQTIAFNSQFEKYSARTIQGGDAYGYGFEAKGNIPSDVITCASLAYNINRKNEFDVRNNVKVIVKISASEIYYIHPFEVQPKNNFLLNINEATARTMSSVDPSDTSKCKDFSDFLKEYNDVKIVNINSTNYNSSAETIYKYYFDVDRDETGNANTRGLGLHYSEITGKVDKIVFTAVPTNKFDESGDGHWSENL